MNFAVIMYNLTKIENVQYFDLFENASDFDFSNL